MKKNFLLLFLMALLPLAGWAQDLSTFTVEIVGTASFVYNGNAQAVTLKVTAPNATEAISSANYDVVYYNEAGTEVIAAANVKNAGNYKVSAKGKGTYTNETAKIAFTITPKNLANDFGTNFIVTTTGAITAYDGKAKTYTTVALKDDALNYTMVLGENKDYTMEYKDNVNAGTAKIEFTGHGNYQGTGTHTFAIAKADIPAGALDGIAPTAKTGLKYLGANQDLVTAGKALDAKYGTVQYKIDGGEYAATIPQVLDANTTGYIVKWKVVGSNNYNDKAEVALAAIPVAKAPLTVMAIAETKVYDGTALNTTTSKFNVSGRVGDDQTKAVTGLVATGTVEAAAKKYTIGVNIISGKIGEDNIDKNYTVTAENVEWEITKRPLKITLPDPEMAKGGDFPVLAAVAATNIELTTTGGKTGAINETARTNLAACFEFKYANAEGEALNGVTAGASGNIQIKDYEKAVKFAPKASLTPEQEALLANYDITAKEGTGTLKVSGAGFTIMPTVSSDIEYGDDYTIGYYTLAGATIDESKLEFKIGDKTYKYAEKDSWELPTERGTYVVEIVDGSVVGTGNNADGTPTLQTSTFSIVKKQLTVYVKNQTVHTNAPKTVLETLTANGKGYVAETSVVPEDAVLVYTFTNDVTINGDDEITAVNGTNQITVALADEDDYPVNANYELKAANNHPGTLTLTSTTETVDLAAATAEENIPVWAANAAEYNVTITDRKLNANQWNVMVLPFAVKPLDFCNAIGQYAVFNTLKSVEKDAEDPEKDKIYFKLEMNEIPANTPFLVKPVAAVNFDIDADENGKKDIEFKGVVFENPGSMQPVYDKVAGATFTGNYAASYDIPSTNYWVLQGGKFVHFSILKTLGFTRAYIELTSGAESARFFIEEPNGNTTAIKELNINTMESVDAEGMYNLNGMKLNGAPTQKGVYIKNGKKYLVK